MIDFTAKTYRNLLRTQLDRIIPAFWEDDLAER